MNPKTENPYEGSTESIDSEVKSGSSARSRASRSTSPSRTSSEAQSDHLGSESGRPVSAETSNGDTRDSDLAASHRGSGHQWLDVGLAAFLLFLSLPILAVVAALILITDGRPIFYGGRRLGRGKKEFTMYKLRTLRVGAEKIVGGQLLSHTHQLTIPCGRFLRDTRIDELPQLWNIVRGEMSFLGPRPERAAVYEALCKGIESYESRFQVLPGLIGYSQLFTPHGTPKRLRARLDREMIGTNLDTLEYLRLVAFTVVSVVRRSSGAVVRALSGRAQRVSGRRPERRVLPRRRPRNAVAIVTIGSQRVEASLRDINEDALRIYTREPLPPGDLENLVLSVDYDRKGRRRRQQASCFGTRQQVRADGRGFDTVIEYHSSTPWHQYVLEQYFLDKSLARPF